MKILQVSFISLALVAAACSKKSDSDRKDKSENTTVQNAATDRDEARKPESAAESAREQEEENQAQPSKDDIADDCRALAWLTKAMPAQTPSAECPQCPPKEQGTEVLKFQGAKVDRVSCAADTCEVAASVHASFNPSKGGTITGGLTGWIPLEQREQYSRGQTPAGEQIYHLTITYRREGQSWRLVDFAMGEATEQGKGR